MRFISVAVMELAVTSFFLFPVDLGLSFCVSPVDLIHLLDVFLVLCLRVLPHFDELLPFCLGHVAVDVVQLPLPHFLDVLVDGYLPPLPVVLVVDDGLLLLDVVLEAVLNVGHYLPQGSVLQLLLREGQMLPPHALQRVHLVHVGLLYLPAPRNELLLADYVETDPVRGEAEVSQLEVVDRCPFLDKLDPRELLELSELPVGSAAPGDGVVLPHGAKVVLCVSELVGKRSEVPVGCRLDVVEEALVGEVVGERKHLDRGQQLDDLPLPLRRVVELYLAGVVEERSISLQLDPLVQLHQALVQQPYIPQRMNHSYPLDLAEVLPPLLRLFLQPFPQLFPHHSFSSLQLPEVNDRLKQSILVLAVVLKVL